MNGNQPRFRPQRNERTALFLAVLLCFGAHGVFGTVFRQDYLPIGDVRTDPIITQDCLADHVHTFYGPALLRPEITYDDLINSPPESHSGNLEENKSLYWHPTVYKYDRISDTYTRVRQELTTVYYEWEFGEHYFNAFPPGFRMIAGYDTAAAQSTAECVGASRCRRDDCYSENDFFPTTACQELEVSMSFPTCWDGRLDSPDHQGHVVYAEEGDPFGACPDSHPKRLPLIQVFFRFFDYEGGWHTFSDGSGVFHSDYISGWDEDLLQRVLDNCDREKQDGERGQEWKANCEDFFTFKDPNLMYNFDAITENVKRIQPKTLPNTKAIAPEEIDTVTGSLPRGLCKGQLLPPGAEVALQTPAPDTDTDTGITSDANNDTSGTGVRPGWADVRIMRRTMAVAMFGMVFARLIALF